MSGEPRLSLLMVWMVSAEMRLSLLMVWVVLAEMRLALLMVWMVLAEVRLSLLMVWMVLAELRLSLSCPLTAATDSRAITAVTIRLPSPAIAVGGPCCAAWYGGATVEG